MDVFESNFWIKILVSILCGTIIGTERQIKGKPSGIRTSIFICLGTNIFITLSLSSNAVTVDMTRVLGQIVTGIGFLGGGVIIAHEGKIKGITSAAVIWMLAGIGAMIGFNLFREAFIIALITVLLLIGIGFIETNVPILRIRDDNLRSRDDNIRSKDDKR